MLTTSCTRDVRIKSGATARAMSACAVAARSLHRVVLPILHARDLAAVPLVDAVVELCAEMILLGPHDRPPRRPLVSMVRFSIAPRSLLRSADAPAAFSAAS